MLHRDIVRLLVRRNPEIAFKLLPTCKTVNRWLESDELLMKELRDHYRAQIQLELDTQVCRMFNQQAMSSVDRHVLNVHTTQSYKTKNVVISYDSGGMRTVSVSQLRTERENPQSKDAYHKLMRLWRRSKALADKFGSTEREQTVEDVCQGIQHAMEACEVHRTPFSWERMLRVWVVCMGLVMVLLGARVLSKGRMGGFVVAMILCTIVCYAVVKHDFIGMGL